MVDLAAKESIYDKLSTYIASLPFPGTFEGLHREIRNIFPLTFDGAKVDFSQGLSQNLQLTNSFMLSSKANVYSFGGVLMDNTQKNFIHGTVDSDWSFQSRGQYSVLQNLTAKGQLQVSQIPAMQVELDFQNKSSCSNLKIVNPTVVNLPTGLSTVGVLIASHLQSITKNIVVGAEVVVNRSDPRNSILESLNAANVSLVGKYTTKDGIVTGNVSPGVGVAQVSYFHRVSEKVELGTELQLIGMEGRREGVCTVGAKYEFKDGASFRGQVDTTGKVSALLEEKLAPPITFSLSGEIDHGNGGASRFGIGLTIEG